MLPLLHDVNCCKRDSARDPRQAAPTRHEVDRGVTGRPRTSLNESRGGNDVDTAYRDGAEALELPGQAAAPSRPDQGHPRLRLRQYLYVCRV